MHSAADEPHRRSPDSSVASSRLGTPNRDRYSSRKYAWIGRGALGIDVAFVVALALNLHGPARLIIGLSFALLIPGWSVVGHFNLKNPAWEFALSVAASLAFLMVAAQILLAMHWWHLRHFDIVAASMCAPSIALQRGVIRWKQSSSRVPE